MKKFLATLALVLALTTVSEAKTVEVTNEQVLSLGAGNWLMVSFVVQGDGWFAVLGIDNNGETVQLSEWSAATAEPKSITVWVREFPHRLFYTNITVEVRHHRPKK